jgi:hypothetical protein
MFCGADLGKVRWDEILDGLIVVEEMQWNALMMPMLVSDE